MKACTTIASIAVLTLAACNAGPSPIRFGEDACAFCRMTIVDQRFGAELITSTGKTYKFDSVSCLAGFVLEGTVAEADIRSMWVMDFGAPEELIPVDQAAFVLSDELRSPMGSGLAAVRANDDPEVTFAELGGRRLSWNEVLEHVDGQAHGHVPGHVHNSPAR